ncbi:MAG: hypothetical protein PSU93_15405 [Methylobacter sp.]|uniref:Uncharacterized protein n=1 Tax=Candidatus Methylobacter titanis TaxID=3053457 RepID=A0AA43Q6C9_9GAMM|nr:hypothetical protein [Candidatus Methylobacter titanis]
MKTTKILLSKLVPHESMATTPRLMKVRQYSQNPIVVKPINDTDYFFVYQGHNRAKLALDSGAKEIEALIGTPDFLERNRNIHNARIRKDPAFPLRTIQIGADDQERKDAFYQDAAIYAKRPAINLHRGTMLFIIIGVEFDDEAVEYKCLPQKGGFGALVFDPVEAKSIFNDKLINMEKMDRAWGKDTDYDPSVLPAYIEVGNNGEEFRGGGFAHDVSFRVNESDVFTAPTASKRPRAVSVMAHVIYPDGSYWVGKIGETIGDITVIVWSDELSYALLDREKANQFKGNWWKTPTSLIFGKQMPGIGRLFLNACGSTCHGGGCLV